MKKNIAHSSLFILVSSTLYLLIFFVYWDIKLQNLNYAWEEISKDHYKKIEKIIVSNNKKVFKRLYIKWKSWEYLPTISERLVENNMPDDLKYIPIVESSLNYNAISPTNSVWLWQLTPQIATQYWLKISDEIDERYDRDISTSVAIEHLNYLYNTYGSWIAASIAYNIWESEMNSLREKSPNMDFLDNSIQEKSWDYIFKVLAYKYWK